MKYHNKNLLPCPDFKSGDEYTESGDDRACETCVRRTAVAAKPRGITTLEQYQNEVLRTLDNPERKTAPHEIFVACMALGLTGEAGEVADHLKKQIWHNHPVDNEKLKSATCSGT